MMSTTLDVKVPAIGGPKDGSVVSEILVKPGDRVTANTSVVMLESDKATVEVPSPVAGTVKEIKVSVGDRVGEGSLLLTLEGVGATDGADAKPAPAAASAPAVPAAAVPAQPAAPAPAPAVAPAPAPAVAPAPAASAAAPAAADVAGTTDPASRPHASPSLRKLARELGVDLARVSGTGRKGRILADDVQKFVKGVMGGAVALPGGGGSGGRGGGLDLLPWPRIDFSTFGPVEPKPLSRIAKISGANLSRNWVMIPHVTQFDEADISELEAFRTRVNGESSASSGSKVTLLAFLIKASVVALKKFPTFNASLDGDNLILKRYFNIGFAADTPNGLVVPVIKGADGKGVLELAKEAGDLAARAREGKLGPGDMQGGCFSISSLGGIGGTAFTPIINAPEVAILGVSRSTTKPVWDGDKFAPRLMLPLSLSYDHRVIDGATAARFITFLSQLLGDLRRVML